MLLAERYLEHCEEEMARNPHRGTSRDHAPQTHLRTVVQNYAKMFPKASQWVDFSTKEFSFPSFAVFFLKVALAFESDFLQILLSQKRGQYHPYSSWSPDTQKTLRLVLWERSEVRERYPFLTELETLFKASLQKSLEERGTFLWDSFRDEADSFVSVFFKYLKQNFIWDTPSEPYVYLSLWSKLSPENAPAIQKKLSQGMSRHFVDHFKNTLLFSRGNLDLVIGENFVAQDELKRIQQSRYQGDFHTVKLAEQDFERWKASTTLLVLPFLEGLIDDLFLHMKNLSSSLERKTKIETAIQQKLQSLPLQSQKKIAIALNAARADITLRPDEKSLPLFILRQAADTLLVVLVVLQPPPASSQESIRFLQTLFPELAKKTAQKELRQILSFVEESGLLWFY